MTDVMVPRRLLALIEDFQKQAGFASKKQAVKGILFLNQALVRDARTGISCKLDERPESSRISLTEIYESTLEVTRYGAAPKALVCMPGDFKMPLRGVDDVALADIRTFMDDTMHRLKCQNASEVLKVATLVAGNMLRHYGSGKSDELHIPTHDPLKPASSSVTHILLKPSI